MVLSELKGVGPTRLNNLRAMGIVSLRDFICYLPWKYEDQTVITPCAEAREGRFMVRGIVENKPTISYFHGISRIAARIKDDSGSLAVCWFNEPWMTAQLPVGSEVSLYGRVSSKNGRVQLQNPKIVTEPGFVPVYRMIRGIPARSFRAMMREALNHIEECCPETLPLSFRQRYNLCDISFALFQCHFPDSLENLRAARRRLDFESMLMYLMCVAMNGGDRQPGYSFTGCSGFTEEFWKLPGFPPTGAQRRVLEEIAADLEKDTAMSRLVQGDVGSGKTALAFGAMYLAWKSGFQSAMMAPTEILARQHYEAAKRILEPQGMVCRLLTGSTRAKERREILSRLADGSCSAVFGTHALISEGVEYHSPGLVITDEQHRFGVRQRSRLQEKGAGEDSRVPHVLVMSATPIPRTLALILYGDLDLSLVDEMPPGRKAVKTRLVPPEKREGMYSFLRSQVKAGRQAYVVCPLVEDSENADQLKSAKSVYEELTAKELADLRVGLTWGGQKSEEKAAVLESFASGTLDVLVATTVIEVGVNVPNATVMVIENAERYGLSQLHQLRGRVGRGNEESWCFLLSGASGKLRVLCQTNDGFEIAKKDLELRGPGDLMGIRQSGEPQNGMIIGGDVKMLDEVSTAVSLLRRDPSLSAERSVIEKEALRYSESRDIRIARN